MSVTILRVNDRRAVFDHHDLVLVVRMATSLMERSADALGGVRDQWERALEMQAPGVLELGLDDWARDAATRARLAAVLQELEEFLTSLGDEVPLEYLKARCPIPGVVFDGPYPSHYLLKAVRQLRQLIEETA